MLRLRIVGAAVAIAILVPMLFGVTPSIIVGVNAQQIPDMFTRAVELVAEDVGPWLPGMVSPGQCINITFRVSLPSTVSAFIWMVGDVNGSLKLFNYSVGTKVFGDRVLELCVPSNAVGGVYDVVVYGAGARYELPRSLWVVTEVPRKLRIAVISDMHFETGTPTPREGDINRFAAALLIHWLNPDIIIHGGDLADTAAEYEYKVAQVYRYTYLYKYPVLSIGGNHDGPSIANYERFAGPSKWYKIIGGKLLIVGIWTGYESLIPSDHISYLVQVLSKYANIPYKIVIIHYPLFFYQGQITASYDSDIFKPYAPGVETPVYSAWNINMTAFRTVLKAFEDYNVTIVIAGHIHRDQFVLYRSVRTGATVRFMTFTTTAHGTPSYNGVGFFEIDLETGEVSFPLQPPGFTGFENSTQAIAYNSLPLGISSGKAYLLTKVFYTDTGYYIRFENTYQWYSNIEARLLWAFPWSGQNVKIVSDAVGGASVKVVDKLVVGGTLFTLMDVKLPYGSKASLGIFTSDDVDAPRIQIFNYVPKIPTLNRSLTLYIKIDDGGWGVDIESIKVYVNATPASFKISTPASYVEKHNSVSLTLELTIRGRSTSIVFLNIVAKDFSGKESSKLFKVTFYPPGVKPSEEPVAEVVQTQTPATGTATTTTPSPTQTIAVTLTQTLLSTTTVTQLFTETVTKLVTQTATEMLTTIATETAWRTTTVTSTTTITQTTTLTTTPAELYVVFSALFIVLIIALIIVFRRGRR